MQAKFHSDNAKYRAYVGGFGSGKTICGVVEDILTMLEYPGIRGLVSRRHYNELKATTQADFLKICPPGVIESLNKSTGLCRFINGSEVYFWNLESLDALKSLNLGFFHIDEASEVGYDIFKALQGRLRQSQDNEGKEIPRRGWLTTNPEGHDWIWDMFMHRQAQKDAYFMKSYHIFRAPTTENIYLPQDYIDDLRSTYPKEWLDKFMSGEFDVFEGQIFTELSKERNFIPDALADLAMRYINERCPVRYRSIDHGFTNPTVCLWGAIDGDGNLFLYREYRKTKALVSDNAREIKRLSLGEDYIQTMIDPSTRNRTGSGRGISVIEEYSENEIYCTPANNQISAGLLRMGEYIKVQPDRINPITKLPGSPKLFFLPGTEKTFDELLRLAWKKVKPNSDRSPREEPIDKDDHGPDALRYLLMDRPQGETPEGKLDPYEVTLSYVRALSRESDGWADEPVRSNPVPMLVALGDFQFEVFK